MTLLRSLAWGLFALACAAATVAAVAGIIYLPQLVPRPVAPPDSSYTRAEFVTIVLTALTAVLAALAIVVAVVGAIGYVQIKSAAKSAAADIARETAKRVARSTAEEVAVREAEKAFSTLRPDDSAAADAIARSQAEGDDGHAGTR